ncbi:MAG TPA: HdeD family acid-resistance protein [Acidimicrobiia bacterium]|jgi:uncharacterized membrane protein HdeD (DUF308 family)
MVILVIGDWRKLAVRGAAAVLFGLLTLIWPRLTLTALVLLFGAYVLVDGLFIVAAVIADTPDTRRERPWLLLEGLASIVIGVVTFIWPHITALALLYLIAFWAAVTGWLELATAARLRHQVRNGWLLAVVGLLSLAFAVVLIVNPGAGALATTWLVGWYALISGALLLGLANELRMVESATGRRGRAVEQTREARA